MSSNIFVNRVCQWCGKEFVARTTTTNYCSHRCSGLAYKERKRQAKLEKVQEEFERVGKPRLGDPLDQVELTPEAKISLTLSPNIKMTPVDVMSAGDFICIFKFRFGRRGI